MMEEWAIFGSVVAAFVIVAVAYLAFGLWVASEVVKIFYGD